jgi:hypothetical protein
MRRASTGPCQSAQDNSALADGEAAANQLGRRNLTPSQKAALALELEKQLTVEAKKRQRLNNANRQLIAPSEKGKARDKAAKMLGANHQYVSDAKLIAKKSPEMLEQVKKGTLSIPQAKSIAVLPIDERPAAVETLLGLEAWKEKSTRTIADYIGVSHPFVSGIKKALATVTNLPDTVTRKNDGTYPATRKPKQQTRPPEDRRCRRLQTLVRQPYLSCSSRVATGPLSPIRNTDTLRVRCPHTMKATCCSFPGSTMDAVSRTQIRGPPPVKLVTAP